MHKRDRSLSILVLNVMKKCAVQHSLHVPGRIVDGQVSGPILHVMIQTRFVLGMIQHGGKIQNYKHTTKKLPVLNYKKKDSSYRRNF